MTAVADVSTNPGLMATTVKLSGSRSDPYVAMLEMHSFHTKSDWLPSVPMMAIFLKVRAGAQKEGVYGVDGPEGIHFELYK